MVLAPILIDNTDPHPTPVSPPDFILTEFVHDKFYNVGGLLQSNAHFIVRDLIKDCDLTKGYNDDGKHDANRVLRQATPAFDIFKQFPTSAFCTNQIYTDSILFRKMFGMDNAIIRRNIQNAHGDRGGRGKALKVYVIDSTPTLNGATVTQPVVRKVTTKPVNLYSYTDNAKHHRAKGGHKKYTPGDGTPSKPYEGSDFQHVFENVPTYIDPLTSIKSKNLFFISDSCSDLIRILSDTPYPLGNSAASPNLNINIMISTHTLADPSPRTDQRAKNFIWPLLNNSATKNIIRYEDSGDLNTIQDCNPLLLINSNVKMEFGPQIQKNIVNQTWNSTNTKPDIQIAHKGNVLNANTNNSLNNLKLKYSKQGASTYMAHAQKKRYGDHGQIAFAKRFPNEAKRVPTTFVTVYDSFTKKSEDAPTILDVKTHGLFSNLDEDNIRKGTYFLTGDWPAFCYAVYNQINSIIHLKLKNGKSEIFVADFN